MIWSSTPWPCIGPDDPIGQLVQARRALQPDGLFLGVLFGGQTLAELRAVLAQAESELRGGLSARILPMAEIRDLGAALQRAGFALPVADSLRQNVAYRDLNTLFSDLRAMGERNALAARPRQLTPRALFSKARRLYAGSFATPDGACMAGFELIFLSGWAPSADQPKPLRPGSATSRLADALGATEVPLPDAVKIPPKDLESVFAKICYVRHSVSWRRLRLKDEAMLDAKPVPDHGEIARFIWTRPGTGGLCPWRARPSRCAARPRSGGLVCQICGTPTIMIYWSCGAFT